MEQLLSWLPRFVAAPKPLLTLYQRSQNEAGAVARIWERATARCAEHEVCMGGVGNTFVEPDRVSPWDRGVLYRQTRPSLTTATLAYCAQLLSRVSPRAL